MKYLKLLWIPILSIIILYSCSDNKAKWEAYEQKLITEYIKTIGDTIYSLKPSGLYYIELTEGTGASPVENDSVFFKYKAMFLDFVVFNKTIPYNKPTRAKIGSNDQKTSLLTGVDEGLRYMKVGGTAKLVIPSKLAYGIYGIPNVIPANTPIQMFLELDSVKTSTGK
jgi:FKBP-type peptidyl-prolyl cis-trans isomerase